MLLVLAAVLIIVSLIIYFSAQWYRYIKVISKIPGPASVPVLGHLLLFLVSPEQLWKLLRTCARTYYPIYKFWQIHIPSVHIVSPDDIEVVLSSTKHTTKSVLYNLLHPWLNKGLLTSEGAKWQARRKILTNAFHFHILQEFLGVFQESGELLVKKLEKECSKPFTDIFPFITQSTLSIICETAMGTKLHETKECQEYTEAVFGMAEVSLERLVRPWYAPQLTFWFTAMYRRQRQLLKTLHSFSKSVIAKRQLYFDEVNVSESAKRGGRLKKKRLAMLDLLFFARNNGEPIDDDGIREEVDTFMFEGHDTTTSCIAFTLMLLACHKDIQEKVVAELDEVLGTLTDVPTVQDLNNLRYLEQVLKESLRLYPSVPLIARLTDEEIHTPSGYTIPAKTNVFVHIYDLHHDPELYPDPEMFDPERFSPENTQGRHPFAYIPFSAGPRNCIGQKFALLEIKTVLAAILKRFVVEPVDTPESIIMMIHFVAKTKNGIRIKFRLR